MKELCHRYRHVSRLTGAPPDSSHDWLLHVVQEGTLQSMNRSYKFESRDITIGKTAPFAVKLTRHTRGTRSMMDLWTGEVTADH